MTRSPPDPRTPLTRERILRAAVTLADEQGLDLLTMRTLGTALGVQAMSLYNHVANKDDVLAGMVDVVTHGATHDRIFNGVWGIAPSLASPAQAKAEAAVWLERLAAKVASENDW